jgi:CheY-like chemotaxis protein
LFRFLEEARLLVVDDEESLRITTAAIFEKEGYIVDTASSGDEAIELLGNKTTTWCSPTCTWKVATVFQS